ncbi:MAG TPA: mycofactocin system transcriptional regulator [Acidimicrobiales bacterium]|nr:mycofactocin system transcriptional regulator [Acidimicrobiales bacterium]
MPNIKAVQPPAPAGAPAQPPGRRPATADQLPGRRPATTRRQLERAAIGLFVERGFERTTVGDIAAAGGIGRRTFFRYFSSKNDVIWGEFDEELDRMRAAFEAAPTDAPLMETVRQVVVASNRYGRADLPELAQRMTLITTTPALRAHSTLRYDAWRRTVADFVARRLGQAPSDLLPSAMAGATLGVAMAAYAYWLQSGAELTALLDDALSRLAFDVADHPNDRAAPPSARRGPWSIR